MTEDSGASTRRELFELRDSPWQSGIARPLLIALQATCLVAGPLAAVQAVTQDDRLAWVTVLAFGAALLGVASAHWMSRPEQRLLGRTTFLIAELVLLLLVVRVASWGIFDQWPTLAMAQGWVLQPWTFFDGRFLAAGILSALAWHRASVVASIFERLALTPGELAWFQDRQTGAAWRSEHPVERAQVARDTLVSDYVTQWLLGGAFLVFFAGATRVRIAPGTRLSVLNTGVPSALIVAIILYFLIGLILTSQARLAMLRAQWLFDDVDLPEQLTSRWQRSALLIVLAVGLLATLLPLGSTWQLGEILNVVLGFVVQVVMMIVGVLIAVLAWFMALFDPHQQMPELPVELQPAAEVVPPVPTIQLPPWLGGAVIWLLVGAIVIYLLAYFFGKQGIALTRKTLRLLWERLSALLGRWRNQLRDLPIGLPGRRQTTRPSNDLSRQPWRFMRLGALSPRDQVRYFYLSTVRRAGERGVIRQPSQTPLEFVRDLESTWPEAELDVEALTEAFITARYDVVEIDPGQAKQARTVWERIKQLLRGQKPGTAQPPAVSESDEPRLEP